MRPTDRQLYAIRKIEQTMGVRFRGTSFKSANQFLWRFMDASMQISQNRLTNEAAWKAVYKKCEW